MPTWREHIDINLAWRVALCAVAAVVVGLGLTWPGHRFPAVGIICLISVAGPSSLRPSTTCVMPI